MIDLETMKRYILVLVTLFISSFFAETIAAASTITTDQLITQGPKPRYKARRGNASVRRIFRVKVLNRNAKIRTKHDNGNKKQLGKKSKNTPNAHKKTRRSKYTLLN